MALMSASYSSILKYSSKNFFLSFQFFTCDHFSNLVLNF